MARIKIALLKSLKLHQAIRFAFSNKGRPAEGFVVKLENGTLAAYENKCRHLPMKLDTGDGRFFTPDGKHLVCQTHNALYDPASGLCVRGPCERESLRKIEVLIEGETVWFEED